MVCINRFCLRLPESVRSQYEAGETSGMRVIQAVAEDGPQSRNHLQQQCGYASRASAEGAVGGKMSAVSLKCGNSLKCGDNRCKGDPSPVGLHPDRSSHVLLGRATIKHVRVPAGATAQRKRARQAALFAYERNRARVEAGAPMRRNMIRQEGAVRGLQMYAQECLHQRYRRSAQSAKRKVARMPDMFYGARCAQQPRPHAVQRR